MTGPMLPPGGAPPMQPPKPPTPPWTPFQTRPNDDEPRIAQLWVSRLSEVMSTVKYGAFSPAWRQPLEQKYAQAKQVLAQAQAAAQPQPGQGRPSAPEPQGPQKGPAPQPKPQGSAG